MAPYALNEPEPSLYDTLQVSPRAAPDVIRAAYRVLARQCHPDLTADREAARRMRALNAAYEVLSDPVRRAQYDVQRSRLARARRLRRANRPYRAGPPVLGRPGPNVWRPGPALAVRFALAALVLPLLCALVLLFWLLYTTLDDRPPGALAPSAPAFEGQRGWPGP